MSHKGSWSRVKNHKAWQESPLWNKKKPQSLIEIIKEYPNEMLSYEQGFDIDQYDLPIETYFESIEEVFLDQGNVNLGLLHAHLNEDNNQTKPRIFLITNNQDQTCKVVVWMD
jgi:hypothetical protein